MFLVFREHRSRLTMSVFEVSTIMPTFSLISLGCPKNLVDSETMTGRLLAAGFEFRDAPPCDLMILNTCGFLASARAEAREHLAELVQWKKRGRIKRILAAGCMVRHEGKTDGAGALSAEFPTV
ncbi:MAG TPA: hypothetical protein DEB39_09055, partial [Planctomycetaceae bacterium]|nr:hypothetical protein [Planctomycetaceae bacterium]